MKKVLVIDDDKTLRADLIEVLGFEGYEAIEAKNGREEIRIAQEHLPRLVICDINMPRQMNSVLSQNYARNSVKL